MRQVALFVLFISHALFGTVTQSVIPQAHAVLSNQPAYDKLNRQQQQAIEAVAPHICHKLRVMSFNMLFPRYDHTLDPADRWETRKERLVEYILWADPDIIGSQELQQNQLDYLMTALKDRYCVAGSGWVNGRQTFEIPAVFYRKERLVCESEKTSLLDSTSRHRPHAYTRCHLYDTHTKTALTVINTHFTFANLERRSREASFLHNLLVHESGPLIVTGDFNTFPFRQDLDLPAYDGDSVLHLIESGGVRDCQYHALYGHLGPISSTNFCAETKRTFCSEGVPGVILDHIFVSKHVIPLLHCIDPARVDAHFPSDHFPVIVDLLISPN